jgi:hypothetical protein
LVVLSLVQRLAVMVRVELVVGSALEVDMNVACLRYLPQRRELVASSAYVWSRGHAQSWLVGGVWFGLSGSWAASCPLSCTWTVMTA